MDTPENIVEDVVDILGGLTKAAAVLNLSSPSVIANWRTRGQVPARRAIQVESLTGISRHKLCPDVFGEAPAKEPAA